MIKSVRLVNWRSHKDTLLQFRPGTNLLVGIMGAGKSSVMEAISFALFGTFPAVERRKLKLENVVRLNEPSARVVLEMEWAGAEYRIERAIERSKKGSGTRAEMYKGGSIVEHSPSGVNAYVSGLLGIEYGLFTRAIYSEQNNIDHFLNLGAGKRKEEMDVLLGLDRFEAARANIVTVINRVNARRQALEGRFSREKLAGLESREKALSSEYDALQKSLLQASGALSAKEREAASASALFETMRKARDAHERLALEEARLSARLESLKKDLEGKSVDEAALAALDEKFRSLNGERARLEGSLKAIDARLSALSKEAGSLEAALKGCAEAKVRLEAASSELASALGGISLQDLEKLQKGAESALILAESERASLGREIDDLEDSAGRLRPGLSECPLCMSKLTEDGLAHVKTEKARLMADKKKRATDLAAQIASLRKENDGLLQRIRRASLLSERCGALRKDAGGAPELEAKRADVEKSIAAVREDRKASSAKADSALREAEALRAQITEGKGLLSRRSEMEAAVKRLGETRSALAAVKYDGASFEDFRIRAEKARIEAERTLSQKRSCEAQAKMSAEMLALLRNDLAAMRQAAEDLRSLAELEEQLAIFRNALLETQTSLRFNLADAINAAMNEVWPVFYPYRNYRALRLGVTDKDYVFEVDEGAGEWKPLETVASGGERACAALALRVALAMVLTPGLGWLILDEPTHNLDAEAVEMLSSALEFKVPEVVKQTFVITHDEAFMGSEFASSYRLVRDKARNGETKAEPM